MLCRSHFGTSVPASYGSRGTSGGARAENLVGNPLAAFFGAQCRQADLFRQIFRSGAADDTHDFVMDPESHRLHWLAKCINIAIRDSGMRGEGQ